MLDIISMNDNAHEIPAIESDDPKEVYAFYGLTSYLGQVFEKGIVNMAWALHLKGLSKITREDAEEAFGLMDRKTLGQLIKDIEQKTEFPGPVKQALYEALKKKKLFGA